MFFRLGLLRYNNNDYSGAVSAFQQAVILDPQYMNARYLLAQAYQKVGRTDDAKTQFIILSKLLPNNQDVKNALDSLSGTTVAPVPSTDNKSAVTTPNTKVNNKTTKPPLSGQH